ncbi:hypothetical protein DFH06DRAFT_1306913 [Mycena polygramma]|nr:hypothetical protein DFH06DRAFT_1306913 [Mycena polygramma]
MSSTPAARQDGRLESHCELTQRSRRRWRHNPVSRRFNVGHDDPPVYVVPAASVLMLLSTVSVHVHALLRRRPMQGAEQALHRIQRCVRTPTSAPKQAAPDTPDAFYVERVRYRTTYQLQVPSSAKAVPQTRDTADTYLDHFNYAILSSQHLAVNTAIKEPHPDKSADSGSGGGSGTP